MYIAWLYLEATEYFSWHQFERIFESHSLCLLLDSMSFYYCSDLPIESCQRLLIWHEKEHIFIENGRLDWFDLVRWCELFEDLCIGFLHFYEIVTLGKSPETCDLVITRKNRIDEHSWGDESSCCEMFCERGCSELHHEMFIYGDECLTFPPECVTIILLIEMPEEIGSTAAFSLKTTGNTIEIFF